MVKRRPQLKGLWLSYDNGAPIYRHSLGGVPFAVLGCSHVTQLRLSYVGYT